MKTILLVEDDKNLSDSLIRSLEAESFKVIHASNLSSAKELFSKEISLIILDWMLPDGQGIDFLKELRKENSEVPVILLTSRAELIDKIVGLELGANDYMTKPFEPRELIARIRAHLRVLSAQSFSIISEDQKKSIELSGISLNLDARDVRFRGNSIELTKMEYHLLKLFMENPNRVFPREALLNEVWGYENYPTTRTIDNHILQLRQKFESSLFETVRGVGYRMRATEK